MTTENAEIVEISSIPSRRPSNRAKWREFFQNLPAGKAYKFEGTPEDMERKRSCILGSLARFHIRTVTRIIRNGNNAELYIWKLKDGNDNS